MSLRPHREQLAAERKARNEVYAQRAYVELRRQAEQNAAGAPWVDKEPYGLTSVTVDGEVDLVALVDALLGD